MSLKAVLFDKSREFFELLGDIFDVTGHKLMVAPDEAGVRKLLESVETDVIILPASELGVWKENMFSGGKPVVPFFICDTQSQMEELISAGFSELNTVVKPFNPLELLNKLVMLNKLEVERDLNLYGLINIILSAMRKSTSFSLEIKGKGGECEIYIDKGNVKASNCGIGEIRNLLSSGEVGITVSPFKNPDSPASEFRDSVEFIQLILSETGGISSKQVDDGTPVKVEEAVIEEELLGKEVQREIRENLHCLSVFDERRLTYKNFYLRVFRGNGYELNFLINAGGLDEWDSLKEFINKVLGDIKALNVVVALTPNVKSIFNVVRLYQENPKLYLITSSYTKDIFSQIGLAGLRVKTIESFAFGSMNLATGHKLRFIPVHHCPYPGSLALHDEEYNLLFTPELASSFSSGKKEEDIESLIKLYHRIYMPSSVSLSKAVQEIIALNPEGIYPVHGHAITDDSLLSSLLDAKVGSELPIPDTETAKEILQSIIDSLEEEQRHKVLDQMEAFAYVKSGRVEDILIEPDMLMSTLVGQIVSSKLSASTKINLLERIYEFDVFIPPF